MEVKTLILLDKLLIIENHARQLISVLAKKVCHYFFRMVYIYVHMVGAGKAIGIMIFFVCFIYSSRGNII